jgi:[ribosomal protein S5]-alanine N-acetyltransferase
MESTRLVIRDFQEEDFASIHAYASDPLVTEYTMWGPNTEEDTLEYLTGNPPNEGAEPS